MLDPKHTSKISHGERGFQWTAPNGYTLSVQYGLGSYCERRELGEYKEPSNPHDIESKDFEMAVFYPNGGFVPIGDHDDVAGWIPAWALPRIMQSMRYFHNGTMTGDCAYLTGFRTTIERIREQNQKHEELCKKLN